MQVEVGTAKAPAYGMDSTALLCFSRFQFLQIHQIPADIGMVAGGVSGHRYASDCGCGRWEFDIHSVFGSGEFYVQHVRQ
jgi:hypothetical protein